MGELGALLYVQWLLYDLLLWSRPWEAGIGDRESRLPCLEGPAD